MSNCSRRVAPLHTNRHCYATQNVTVDGSSTYQINVILQFACMCVCVCVCVCVFIVCSTPNVFGLSQVGRRLGTHTSTGQRNLQFAPGTRMDATEDDV